MGQISSDVTSEHVVETTVKIEGEGKIVEIDEAKFGKRRRHRKGRIIEGKWIFGGREVI